MTDSIPLVAGLELGGTKCIAIIARGREIVRMARVPTGRPEETIPPLLDQLALWRRDLPFEAIGLASFGPIILDPAAPDYGAIVNTPKPEWSGFDVRGAVAARFDLPIRLDTDVGAAALAEGRWGAATDCAVHIYVTVGTGVGAGIVVDGKVLHGALHPEVGHIRVPRHKRDAFPGVCPFHGDCIEGLVSGPALSARVGSSIDALPPSAPLWEVVAEDIAGLMAVLILTLSPSRIVLGGGVMERRAMLLARIRVATSDRLNGYLANQHGDALQRLIVAPQLGSDAGPLGAVCLGMDALAAE